MSVPIPPVGTQHRLKPQLRRIPLRIAVVQLRPKICEVDANIARARELCFKLKPHSIDILCFPEMAFTGYVFDSAEAISPYLEEPRTGPSSLFCQEVAKHLGCYVAGGYPERLSDEERRAVMQSESLIDVTTGDPKSLSVQGTNILPADSNVYVQSSTFTSATQTRTPVGANSAIIYGPSGEWVGGYRKTNLFDIDKTWVKPGNGFTSFSLTLPSVSSTESGDESAPTSIKMSIGICMDLNPHPPHKWTDEGPYELADYCVQNQSKLLVLLNAWLYSGLGEAGDQTGERDSTDDGDVSSVEEENVGEEVVDAEADEPDWHTLRYWANRLQPLWKHDRRRRGSNETLVSNGSGGEHEEEVGADVEEEEEKPTHETIVLVCNRTGKENDTTFAGSSAIFSMYAGSGRPKLLDMMGKNEEGVRVWNLLV